MTAPLAVVLLFSAASAAAAPCRVPAVDARDNPVALEDTHPTCLAASAQLTRFEKLRAAAGFGPTELGYYVEVGAAEGHDNGYYWNKRVAFNDAYLKLYPSAALPFLATLAHEIGHAVQDRDGDLEWRNRARSTGHAAEAASRTRRLEAHADAIGIELLLRAGYPADAFVKGREARFTCEAIAKPATEKPGEDDTHPDHRHRWLNSLLATPRVVEELTARRREELSRLNGASAATLEAAFTGAARRDDASVAFPAVTGPRVYKPHFKKEDFDDHGRIAPGRLASSDLRLSLPPPDAGPFQATSRLVLLSYTDRLADATQNVVNWWYGRQPLSDLALEACGKVTGADYGEAVSIGVRARALQATERVTAWLDGLRKK